MCWSATPRHGACPVETPLKKTYFVFTGENELQKTSRLEMGPHVHLPFSFLRPCLDWFCAGLVFARIVFVHSFMHQLFLEDTASLELSTTFDSYNLSLPLPPYISEPQRKKFDKCLPFITECVSIRRNTKLSAQIHIP